MVSFLVPVPYPFACNSDTKRASGMSGRSEELAAEPSTSTADGARTTQALRYESRWAGPAETRRDVLPLLVPTTIVKYTPTPTPPQPTPAYLSQTRQGSSCTAAHARICRASPAADPGAVASSTRRSTERRRSPPAPRLVRWPALRAHSRSAHLGEVQLAGAGFPQAARRDRGSRGPPRL